MLSSGLVTKILHKIQEARRPERFTQDLLETKLGFSGGSAMAAIPLLKRLGLLSSDGTPTEAYDRFRNEETQGVAMANAMRVAYKEMYDSNEYAHDLSKEKLEALVTQITGLERDSRVVKAIASTFIAFKGLANFDAETPVVKLPEKFDESVRREPKQSGESIEQSVDLRLSYTINLNLPETTNPEVFNAIFRSLKENLLKR